MMTYTIDSKIGELLDNPKTKAVLDKHIPKFTAGPLPSTVRDVSLKWVSGYSDGTITPDVLAAIHADLLLCKKIFTVDSKVGELLNNPQTKAVLDKHIPAFTATVLPSTTNDVSLRLVSGYSGGTITPDRLAAIDADLAKL